MASLPEIQGDEDVDVEKVITDVTGFLQNYDTTSNCHKQQKLALNYALMSNDEDSKEETAAAVDILDELLKCNDITEEEFAPVLSSEDLRLQPLLTSWMSCSSAMILQRKSLLLFCQVKICHLRKWLPLKTSWMNCLRVAICL